MAALRPAVFLDRDGTLIHEIDYLADPDAVELVPGSGEALAALQRAGFGLVLVTNQSGVARGLVSPEVLDAIHARLAALLAEHGVTLDDVQVCPHHPDHGPPAYRVACGCRKPAPGMLLASAAAHDWDLAASWVVGDAPRDLAAGAAVRATGILVRTGKGARSEAEVPAGTVVVDDLPAAARHVLAQTR
jgi:D-glycero-D-manno-heptose 1,7-bisphosphate phosphatase